MNPQAKWEEQNAEFTFAALACLRMRLQQQALKSAKGTGQPGIRESEDSYPSEETWVRALAAAEKKLAGIEEATEHDPALEVLGRLLGLSEFEKQVLFLCAAPELDPSFSALFAQVQRDPAQTFPTFALALACLDNPAWDVLSPNRPLRYWRLLEINQSPGQPLIGSALRVDERVVSYLRGLNYLDDRLAAYVSEVRAEGADLPASQRAASDEVVKGWTEAQERIPVIQLVGPDGVSKQLVAAHAAAQIGRRLYQMHLTTLPQQAADVDSLARMWQRECVLLPFALYIDAQGLDQNHSESHNAVQKFLSKCEAFLMVAVREAIPALACQGWTVEISRPTTAEQCELWREELAAAPESAAAELSAQFNLNATDIRRVARIAAAREDGTEPLAERAWRLSRALVRPQLDSLARRIEAKAGWDDIVLPAQETAMLRQIAAQVSHRTRVYEQWGYARKMNRGLGISALFCGESGTGKTMAAEVIANELRLNLYRIDLSAVVSKYIGETEKNLCRLFDAAEDGGAILFFDEADALFGKRSEVKDSHDRYANIEINYLLQRIESYRGLAILASNMRSALDSAFIRRLRFVVNFPFPTVADRKRMWEKAFPAETPVRALDGAELPDGGGSLQGGYRGVENQLYRVEIHDDGTAGDGATFKWSRENGSVVFPVMAPAEGNTVSLGRLGQDRRSKLQAGDWVEISDDATGLHTAPEPLLQVQQIHNDTMQVVLSGTVNSAQDLNRHPVLRRWDQKPAPAKKSGQAGGAIPIHEGEDDNSWIALENGIEIQFQEARSVTQNHYRSGDYWLIPARRAISGIEWPAAGDGTPEALPPHGIDHHYGPLAILEFQGNGVLQTTGNCRRTFRITQKFTID